MLNNDIYDDDFDDDSSVAEAWDAEFDENELAEEKKLEAKKEEEAKEEKKKKEAEMMKQRQNMTKEEQDEAAQIDEKKSAFQQARDVFGEETIRGDLAELNLSTKEDFESLQRRLVELITPYSATKYFPSNLTKLFRALCADMKPQDISEISDALKQFSNAKRRDDKKAAKMKLPLNKQKPSLKSDRMNLNDFTDMTADGFVDMSAKQSFYDDDDGDFM
ncbi:hypothetical protein SNEBB_007747 [Seison nebaliae]|nr:hypothetical protein SNEBB_007747 [Seison nebaliae]